LKMGWLYDQIENKTKTVTLGKKKPAKETDEGGFLASRVKFRD